MSNSRVTVSTALLVWKCAHDEVSGQRSFDAGISRFFVSHFSDHDHIRVGAKKCAHGCGEGEVDLRLDLHLPESILCDFHGVFRRPDFNVGGVDVSRGRSVGSLFFLIRLVRRRE